MEKNTKLITCKHCGKEIAASAKTCPHCGGKNKKPFYKNPLVWILAVILLAAGCSVCGSDTETVKKQETAAAQAASVSTVSAAQAASSSSAEEQAAAETEEAAADTTEETAEAEAAEADVQTIYHVGDTLHDGNMDIVYIASGEYTETNEFLQPEEGYKYIFQKFAFINTSDDRDASVSQFNFECYADGYACDAYFGGGEGLSATLSAGRSTTGNIYFKVPVDASEIEIEYDTYYFSSDKITFAYEGDMDSGYVLEANAEASADALKVGETIESKILNISYLSCFEDNFDNMFAQPKDGYHFITCEFEFENMSNSDQLVSMYSFDCFADGVSCEMAYYREDTLNATLSAGRKAKGTVTFEVPVDASVVEVEYLTNAWTSNRVVFDASELS